MSRGDVGRVGRPIVSSVRRRGQIRVGCCRPLGAIVVLAAALLASPSLADPVNVGANFAQTNQEGILSCKVLNVEDANTYTLPNILKLRENAADLTPNPSCSLCVGDDLVERLCFVDTDEASGTSDWRVCFNGADFARLVNTGSDQITNAQILVGQTTAGTGAYVAMSGDATIDNAGAVTVGDDSHAHTGTTLSGIDISDDTNLSAAAPATLTGDQISVTDASTGAKGVVQLAGDLAGTATSPSVVDDSHSHTGATISGVDISSDTNLSASSPIVLTGDDLSCPTCNTSSADITDVWACTSGNCNALTGASGDTLDAGSADSSKPCKRGTLASRPATCAEGDCYHATDGGGSDTAICTATNTWTTLLASGDAAGGDLGGTYPNPSVTDDSHSHTGTTLSGIDISDDTNLAAGAGLSLTGDTLATASTEAAFLADGGTTDLTCGGSNQGKLQVLDDGQIQWCDGATTSVLRRAAFGNASGEATAAASDSVALSTDTTGNYVASLSCGSGISGCPAAGEGATGTLTVSDTSATNEIQNLFETINAPSGTDPVADSSTDTLNLAASGIITITGDSSTDTITIGATEVDGSTTNEINTVTADSGGATTGLGITLAGGGIVATSRSGDTVTITGTEVDGSTTNEINTITADTGGATTGVGITLTGAGSVSTARSGDTVTITGTDTNTNAATICAGTTTYLDGEGNCDDISSVYAASGHTHAFGDITGQVGDTQIADGAVDGGTGGEIADGTIGYADANATATLAGNPAFGDASVWLATTGLIFEGSTSNTSETLLTVADPTGDRTLTLPDESGTVCTTGSVCSGYQAGPLSGDVVTSGATATIQANSVALGTDTTGNYAAGDGEAGNATGVACTDCVALGTETSGNYVASATASGGLTMTGTEGGSLGVLLPSATDALSATTSSGSGLELLSAGLALLQGCSDGQVLKWTEASDVWGCAADSGSSAVTTLAGDSGTATGSTVTVAGGTNGIDTSATGSTVTLNLDTTEIGTTTFGAGSSFTWTLDGGTGTDATIAVSANGTVAQTGSYDFGGASLEVPNGTTAMSTCTVGQIKQDTDAAAGERLRLCIATDTAVGIDNAFGSEIDATELAATLAFSGQELDLNTNSGNSLRLPVTGTNPATAGGLVIDSTAPYELEWYAGSGLRGLVNYALLAGRSGGQSLFGGTGSGEGLTLFGAARSDGNDDAAIGLHGGGAAPNDGTRGARLFLMGNEAVSNILGGQVLIYAGDDPTGIIRLFTGTGVQRVLVENDGDVLIGAETSGTARLDVTEATIGNEVFAVRSNATNDDPNLKVYQSRATTTANTTTNIDFSLTGGDVPCPASSVCLIEARTVCRCTGGASCTTGEGGGNVSIMAVKNVSGTITQQGTTTNVTSTAPLGAGLTSFTLSVSSPNARMAVAVPANYSHTCHITWNVQSVGS